MFEIFKGKEGKHKTLQKLLVMKKFLYWSQSVDCFYVDLISFYDSFFLYIFIFPFEMHWRQQWHPLIKAATKPHMAIIIKLFSLPKPHMTIIIWLAFVEIHNFIVYYKVVENVCGGFQGHQPCPHILRCSRGRLKKWTTACSLARSFQTVTADCAHVRTGWSGVHCCVILVQQNEIHSKCQY